MLPNIQRNIIIRAIRIRQDAGENPQDILAGYTKLTDAEKKEILAEAAPGEE